MAPPTLSLPPNRHPRSGQTSRRWRRGAPHPEASFLTLPRPHFLTRTHCFVLHVCACARAILCVCVAPCSCVKSLVSSGLSDPSPLLLFVPLHPASALTLWLPQSCQSAALCSKGGAARPKPFCLLGSALHVYSFFVVVLCFVMFLFLLLFSDCEFLCCRVFTPDFTGRFMLVHSSMFSPKCMLLCCFVLFFCFFGWSNQRFMEAVVFVFATDKKLDICQSCKVVQENNMQHERTRILFCFVVWNAVFVGVGGENMKKRKKASLRGTNNTILNEKKKNGKKSKPACGSSSQEVGHKALPPPAALHGMS